MITTAALAISAAAFVAAWVLERRVRRGAQQLAERYREDNEALRKANDLLTDKLLKKQTEIEVLEELQEIGVIQHLESTVQVTGYNGLPVYTWFLSSPYPTLAEAVRHVPARR